MEMIMPTKIGGDRRQRAGLSHFENSTHAFECVHMLWPECEKAFAGHDSIRQHRWKDCSAWLNSVKQQGKKKRKQAAGQQRSEVEGAARCKEAFFLLAGLLSVH